MTLLYFAWVRQKLGTGEEHIELPPNVRTVAELADFLRARGGPFADIFVDTGGLRAAVNQEHAKWDSAVGAEDEVAFFPPVTGG
ncbi:MAG TPA: molybdopterin converting factor subunit 1 [Rhizomicrobium sp.]|nr:molybdopterin converting factor subunit 1 [Rhizomicrobium sp.]